MDDGSFTIGYLACGTPVVAVPDLDGSPCVVRAAFNGWSVAASDGGDFSLAWSGQSGSLGLSLSNLSELGLLRDLLASDVFDVLLVMARTWSEVYTQYQARTG